ncbi:MAG: raffinose/stachyose/melibiose transport system substrate-binding protein [Microbacteriaceae bacterium]|nr:raffinose/stachyose/melibiose transport system substrate-binding protein [Microbacteriaceae bacterium]
MKSRLAIAAAAVSISLALAGCSGASSAGSPPSGSGPSGSLEVQTGLAVDSKLMATLKSVTAGFEKANPNVTINLVPSPGSTYESNMKVRLASGNIPDIWWTHGWSRDRYSKFLMPLQKESWAKDFNPALDAAMKDSNGAFYAMPIDTDIAGLIYNKDVLAKAGYKASDIKTWDDFTKAAEAMKKLNGVSPIYVAGTSSVGNVADWIAPGAFSASDLKKMSAGTFLSTNYKKVLDLVATWTKDGLFNPDYSSGTSDSMAKALAQGQTGFEFSQNAAANNALQYNPGAKLGYMPVPSLNGDPSYLIGGEMNAYGISKTTKNPSAAKAFLAYLALPANETKLAASAGSAPGLTNAKAELGVLQSSYDTFVLKEKSPLVPYFDRVYLPNGSWDTMVTSTDAVVTNQSTSAAATQQVASTFQTLYGQGK